jgi:multidrug efflux pump subunit AcrA (membrane-fusion protein)
MKRRAWFGFVIVAVVLGPLAVLLGDRVQQALAAREAAAAPLPLETPRVRTEAPGRHEIVETLRFTGTLRASRRVDVLRGGAGRIESIEAKIGDRVAAKQVLAVIEHRSLELQRGRGLGVPRAHVGRGDRRRDHLDGRRERREAAR